MTHVNKELFHCEDLNQLIDLVSQKNPNGLAYQFIENDTTILTLTYSQLVNEVNKLANLFKEYVKPEDRVILAIRPGLEYIIGFFACLRVGAIAVPVFPPANTMLASRCIHIMTDSKPSLVVCDDKTRSTMHKGMIANRLLPKLFKSKFGLNEEFQSLFQLIKKMKVSLVSTEQRANYAPQFNPSCPTRSDDVAFLQYTSGSTGHPKGVMLTHGNLLDNMDIIKRVIHHSAESHMFSWLPPYHDMGLIAGILEPLYAGIPSTLLSPVDFIQRPSRWVEYISKFRCTTTGGPNFAFELCALKTSDSIMSQLDLSCLEIAANGAEPISVKTMDLFYEKFSPVGLRTGVILPCYGLAEATVMVTGKRYLQPDKIIQVNSEDLTKNKVTLELSPDSSKTIISSGIPQMELHIVNPNNHQVCSEDEVGEIWVHGSSVAKGYFNNSTATLETFHNLIEHDTPGKHYLKTGDLGFLHGGELFICSRLKDLIIIHGQNYYPHDFEWLVASAHKAIRKGCVIAYSESIDNSERLILVVGIASATSSELYPRVISNIQKEIAQQFHLFAEKIYLIPSKFIPKTSSGKLQRKKCAELINDKSIKILYQHEHNQASFVKNEANNTHWKKNILNLPVDQRESILIELLSNIIKETFNRCDDLDINQGFFEMGIDSLMAVELKNRVQQAIGSEYELNSTVFFDHPNIKSLANYLGIKLNLLDSKDSTLSRIEPTEPEEPIAIIGMSGKFPNADNIYDFWTLLHAGLDGVCDIPSSRWDINRYFDPNPQTPGKMSVQKGGFINKIDQFDTNFFAISPKEAEYLDPQQRLLLEQTWFALEHSSIPPDTLKGMQTGVFIGISTHDYSDLITHYTDLNDINPYFGTGNAFSTATGRISYILGLQGPNMAIDTACSSSLVALHEACKSLQRGECNLAITGGVNALLSPDMFINFSKAGMLAPDGHCKTFDAKADGYARGEGCGIVILKRLSDALRAKDRIMAVIKGSGINQDGASSGLTVPNGAAQEQLLTQVLKDAKLKPTDVDYIECHGTGTSLGDPIEVHAIGQVYGVGREEPLHLGSVKSNIGHLEAAAGIAGLIKAVLALEHEELPKNLHFETLNPHIELNFPAEIVTQSKPWVRGSRIRRAGISAFGFSGTNAHVILEEAPISPIAELETGDWVICLSAKTASALEQLRQDYIQHLEFHPDERIQDIVFTANTGRARLDCKAYFKASTRDILLDNLKNNMTTDEPECTPIRGNKLTLSSYPFERQRYWLEMNMTAPQVPGDSHPFLLREMDLPEEHRYLFETDISKTWPEFMPDHMIYGQSVVAGASYLSAVMSVVERVHETKKARLRNIEIIQPVVLSNQSSDTRTIRIGVNEQDEMHVFKISSFSDRHDVYLTHVQGEYVLDEFNLPMMNESLESIQGRCIDVYTKAEHSKRTSGLSYELGPHFSWIEQVNYNEHELIATLRLPDKVESKHYLLYPGFIDACFQTIFAWLSPDTKVLSVPIAIQSFHYDLSGLSRPEYVYIRRAAGSLSGSDEFPALDIYMLDRQGQVLGLIEGFQTRAVTQSTLMNIILQQHQGRSIHYDYVEHWEKRVIVEAAASAPHGSILLMTARQHAFSDALFLEFQHHDVSVTMSHSLCELPLIPVETIILMLTPEESALDIPDAYREQLRVLFDVTQALIQSSWEKSPRLWLVTQGGQRIMPDDEIHLSVSGVMGFYKTLIQEHPEFQARLIDVEPRDASFVAEQFYRLYSNSEQREGIWAIRAENYYVQRLIRFEEWQRLEQHRVKQTATEVLTPPTAILTQINPEQPIIIIGGMGGLGYALAGSCIAHGALTLILTGRKVQDESMTARIDALIEKNTRVKIVYEAVDITNSGDCQRLMSQWADAQIVFNTAGVIEDATLNHLTWEAVNRVILPKVDGTWHLYQALQLLDIPLISFSSIASILGSGGQAAYAAANGFLNALSALSHQQYPLLSIAWGPWADVGMAKDLSQRHLRSGVRALKPDAGLNALWQLLGTKDVPSTVMVADMQWDKLSGLSSWAFLENLAPKTQLDSGQWVAYLQKLVPEKRQEVLRDKIRELVAEVMGMSIASVSDDKGFFELGMDSLMAVELKNRLDHHFSGLIEFKQSILFEENTTNKLAKFIQAELSQIDFSTDLVKDPDLKKIEYPIKFELSHVQKRFYLSDLINKKKAAYNISMTCRFNFNIDLAQLTSALESMVNHHTLLKSKICIIRGLLYSVPDVSFDINQQIYFEMNENLDSMFTKINQFRHLPFILDDGPLIRFVVYKVDQHYYLQTIFHHVICDAISSGIYLNLLSMEYHRQILPSIRQYSEFAGWFEEYQKTNDYQESKKYWTDLLDGLDHEVFVKQTDIDIQIKTRDLSIELTDSIRYFCKAINTTPQPLFVTVFYALLSNKMSKTRMSIGTLFSGRLSQEWNNTLGAFANLLPIVFNYDSIPNARIIIQDIARQIATSSDHSLFPIEELGQLSRHDKEHNNLFEFILVYQNSMAILNDLTVIEANNGLGTDPFILEVREGKQFQLIIKYNQSVFTEDDIEHFFSEMSDLLEKITFQADENLNGLDISKFERINIEKKEIGLLSNFTIDPIEPFLDYWIKQMDYPYHIKIGGFNQIIQNLLDEQGFIYRNKANVVFISLHDWLQSDTSIVDLVNELIDALTIYCSKNKQVMIIILTPPPPITPHLKSIKVQEERIKQQFETTSTLLVYTHQDLMNTYSDHDYFDEYTDKQAAIPYTEEFYLAMARFVIRQFSCTLRQPKKVVVLDCDNTLWQGVVGEDGVDGLQIKNIHSQLQYKMKALREQGFLLALCSKNAFHDVKSVFEHRQDMILTWDDFAAHQINWNSKSGNIQLIASELNLGIDSFIFIDDNQTECLEVKQCCPGVEVIHFDDSQDNMADYLNSLWCFDLPKQTKEDALRADFYTKDKARELIKTESSNLDDFIKRLKVKVVMDTIQDSDYPRVSQLTLRTTQFNSSNHQYNEQEISQFINKKNTIIYTVTVSDQFGDYGLVGVMMLSHSNKTLTVDGLWLSCRALGRGVEKQIYDQIKDYGVRHDCKILRFLFKKTNRNTPVELFLQSIGCDLQQDAYVISLTNKDI